MGSNGIAFVIALPVEGVGVEAANFCDRENL
jgi:hypothetical protein